MNIKALKEAIADLPDDSDIDILCPDGEMLLLEAVEPSDRNNTIAFIAVQPT